MRSSRKSQVSSRKGDKQYRQIALSYLTISLTTRFQINKFMNLKSRPCDLRLVTCDCSSSDFAGGVSCF